jgi:hypothetical protein
MKNTIKVLGIITLVAVIGFSFAACGGDDDNDGNDPNPGGGGTGGTLIVTGIPSAHNGKYAIYYSVPDEPYLYGVQSINDGTEAVTPVQISNGSVSLPMWVRSRNSAGDDTYTRFSGNRTVGKQGNMFCNYLWIVNAATPTNTFEGNSSAIRMFESVTFSNGNASISWSNGQ